ncbi:dUTP diphosphatase [Lysinibacillus sp. FSL K6-3209]|uniref:dUTP diphosphatase n=1 Tax=Lysinibacillus sp. FSL K6-3209 TaxID=2921497 RepID=UPI0030DAB934
MNLTKLFETQAALDEHIMQEHPELRGQNNLDWKLLALQVELSECANEWRGFKKWSKDQKPRNKVKCEICNGKGKVRYNPYDVWFIGCSDCNGNGYTNSLLEDYVDCLHFILSIGLELVVNPTLVWDDITTDESDITRKFLDITSRILEVDQWENTDSWEELFEEFYLLGKLLGFTWEEVAEAYYAKNKVNHERQNAGY